MARNVTVSLPNGKQAEATEIEVESANERWSEYKLKDGTVFRAKLNILSVIRVNEEYDENGNPMYQINATPTFGFVEVPESVKGMKRK